MSTTPKSIKCSLVIDDESIMTMVKSNDSLDPSRTLREIRFACLNMLKNYQDSEDCSMVLQFKQVHNISMAIEGKIAEYLQGRLEPETKNINLKFQDDNGTNQSIGFTLLKVF